MLAVRARVMWTATEMFAMMAVNLTRISVTTFSRWPLHVAHLRRHREQRRYR